MGKILTPEEYLKKVAKEDKDTIINLQDRKPIGLLPTGSWVLNQIIGDGTMTGKAGGFPRGHIVELLGDESSGKTTLALSAIRQAQETGGFGILVDFEQTFHAAYAEKIGLSLDANKLIVAQPNHFQQGARQIKDFFQLKPAIIVVDSVSAMTPKQVLEGEVDEAGRIGLQAQLMSAFLSYISKFLKNSDCCLLFTNQLRSIIKKTVYETGPNEEGSGGRALRFYSSLRIKLKKSTVEHVNTKSLITGKTEKEPVNVTVKATVIKNKIDKPYYTAPLYIRFGEGVDNISSVIDLAINTGLIKKESKTFLCYYQDGKLIHKSNSRDKLWHALNDDEALFNTIKGNLRVQQDTQAKEEYTPLEDENPPDEMEDMLENVASTFIEKKQKKEKQKNGEDE